MAVYGVAPSQDMDFNGVALGKITYTKVYTQEQGYTVPINGNFTKFANPYTPLAIIDDGDNGFAMTGIWHGKTPYGSSSLINTISDNNYIREPFFVKEDLTNQCAAFIEGSRFYGTFGGHNYFISEEKATRPAAQAIAQANGGNLLTINSKAEEAFLDSRIYGGEVWLGLSDTQIEGIPQWDNGEAVDYTNWNPSPDGTIYVSNSPANDYVVVDFSDNAWAFTTQTENFYIIELDCGMPYSQMPDIQIDSLGDTPSIIQQNEAFTVDFKLYNLGTIAATNYEIKAYLSQDNSVSADDYLVANINQANTPVGTDMRITATLNAPSDIPLGEYTLLIVADEAGQIDEIAEDNNTIYLYQYNPIKVVGLGADLAISNMQDIPSEANQGDIINFSFDLENLGNTIATGDYDIEFYLSTDRFAQYDEDFSNPSDLDDRVLVGLISTGNTPVGTIEDVNASIGIPNDLAYGRYTLYAFVDVNNNINEIDENNNNEYYYFNDEVTIRGEYGADLFTAGTQDLPATVNQGEVLTFDYILENLGEVNTNPENGFNVRYYLSTSPIVNGYIYQQETITDIIPSEGSINHTGTFEVPYSINPGTYYLIIELDFQNHVIESDDDNNRSQHIAIEVMEVETPDLTVSDLKNLPEMVGRDEIVPFNFDLNNIGKVTADGDFRVGMYLHTSDYFYNGIPDEAIKVGVVDTGNIPVGTENDVNAALGIPGDIIPGEYYLVIYADVFNDIEESNELNNYIASDFKLSIISDFVVNMECPNDINVNLPIGATDIPVSWNENQLVITNNCDTLMEHVIISQTAGLSNGSKFPEGTTTIEFTTEAYCIQAPYIATCTFDVNVMASNITNLPDLTISNLTNVPTSGIQGEIVSFNFDLNNIGNNMAGGDYNIHSFLSTDATYSTDDIQVGLVPTGNTPVGTISNVTAAIQIPDNFTIGDYCLIVVADSDDDIIELDESNNSVVECSFEVLASTNPVYESTINVTLCEGDTYNNILYESDITVIDTLIFAQYDSIITTHITVNPTYESIESANICQGGSYEFGGESYTESGMYTQNLLTLNGCDSIIHLNLVVSENITTNINLTTCDPTMIGTESEIFMAQSGCDSIVITNIMLAQSDVTQANAETCNPNEVGTFSDLYTNQYGCDSLVITTVELLPIDVTNLTVGSCNPDEVGTTTEVYTNQYGCDSTVITTTTLEPSVYTTVNATTCDPESEGTVVVTLPSNFGCDSIVTIITELRPTDLTEIEIASCNPADLGTETIVLQNQYGCDSTVIITTTLEPELNTLIELETCNPAQAGTETEMYISQSGCDSIVTTVTTLLESSITNLEESICIGESITINGTIYDENNTMGQTVLTNYLGCDSLVNVNIEILPTYNTTNIIDVQEGETVLGAVITNDTTIVEMFTAVNGCDSTVFNAIFIGDPNSVDDIIDTNIKLKLYPNPTNAEFTIDIQTKNMDLNGIHIFNTLGQQVQDIDLKQLRFDGDSYQTQVRALPKGTYLVLVKTKHGQVVEKLIVL